MKKNLEIQADRMKKISTAKFTPVPVGKTVSVPVPDVDRGKTYFRDILAVVIEIQDNFNKIGIPHGIMCALCSCNQFTPCEEDLVPISDILHKEKSLRQIVTSNSVTGGQGFQRRNCRQKCTTKRCSCRAQKVLRISRCHNSESCTNK